MDTSFQLIQRFLIVGAILTLIAIIAIFLFDHTLAYFHYAVAALFCFTGLHYFFVGLAHLREAQRQGQDAIWHKQPALLIGLWVLLGAFSFFIFNGGRTIFPRLIANIVDTPLLIFIVISSLFLFIRAVFYGIKNRRHPTNRTNA